MAMPPAESGGGATNGSHAFPRSCRLKRRKLIRALFDRRRNDTDTVAVGCVRIVFRVATTDEVGADVPVQAGFAPGRCPNAVTRNRVRRLLREAYRRHQHALCACFDDHPGVVLTLMALFRGNPRMPEAIHRDLPKALQKMAKGFRKLPTR